MSTTGASTSNALNGRVEESESEPGSHPGHCRAVGLVPFHCLAGCEPLIEHSGLVWL